MDKTIEPEIDALLAKTPFHLPAGCGLVPENRNTACSHAEIEELIQKQILNRIDLEIMKVLTAFPFLNHRNLQYALAGRLPPEIQKDRYTDNLKKLKSAGILLCYCMEGETAPAANTEKERARDEGEKPVSPLRLYTLSRSAYTYMEKIVTASNPCFTATGTLIIKQAAVSQFSLRFADSYQEQVREIRLQKTVRNGKDAITIDGILQFFPPGGKTGGNNLITIILLSVREEDGWQAKETARLKVLSHWLAGQSEKYLSPVIIFCVEQISMALSLHTCIQTHSLLSFWEKYYCPDSLLTVYPPLKALYRCETNGNGTVRAIRLNP